MPERHLARASPSRNPRPGEHRGTLEAGHDSLRRHRPSRRRDRLAHVATTPGPQRRTRHCEHCARRRHRAHAHRKTRAADAGRAADGDRIGTGPCNGERRSRPVGLRGAAGRFIVEKALDCAAFHFPHQQRHHRPAAPIREASTQPVASEVGGCKRRCISSQFSIGASLTVVYILHGGRKIAPSIR